MTNTTLRERLKMPEKQRSMVSVLIQEAIDKKLVKPADPKTSPRSSPSMCRSGHSRLTHTCPILDQRMPAHAYTEDQLVEQPAKEARAINPPSIFRVVISLPQIRGRNTRGSVL